MVWIHGGFLQFGSGHRPGLSPNGRLARRLNVVFVSMNYRLHVLGFLALDDLVNSLLEDSWGNYGMWDLLVALQWVQDNIRYFGGNPRKVTVFGPDAGSSFILAMMASQQFQGMFRSAWLIGPAVMFNRTFADAAGHNKAYFLHRSGCGNAGCLRQMTPKEITGTYVWNDDPSFRIRDQNDLPIQGILPEQLILLDGELLTSTPAEAAVKSGVADIPLLIGTGAQSVDFWPGPEDIRTWSWQQYRKYVTTSLDSFGPRVSQLALQMYNSTTTFTTDDLLTPELVYTTMVTDVRQTCPINEVAEIMASDLSSNIYRYIMTSRPPKKVRIYNYEGIYSIHLWEMVAFFDQFNFYLDEPTSKDYQLRDSVHRVVMEFVRSGGKRVPVPQWLRYPKKVAFLSHNITVSDSYHKTKCKFWAAHGLNDYAWVS